MKKKKDDQKQTEDIDIEEISEVVPDVDEVDVKKRLDKLKKRLSSCLLERQEYLSGWQRAKADLINERKAFEDEKQVHAKIATGELVSRLTAVLDSFDMASANKEVWDSVDENWRVGIEHIHGQLLKVLEDSGLEVIKEEGIVFNPTLHESVDTAPASKDHPANTVIEVIQKGYKLRERVLRAAKVQVAIDAK